MEATATEYNSMIERFITLRTDQLVKADWNYKLNDSAMLDKLVANIQRNGQVENLIVRELDTGAFEIVNGNHRYDALQKLGISEVMVCNIGKVTQAYAQRLAIETNETKFKNDVILLAERVQELLEQYEVEDLRTTMPFSDEELKHLTDLDKFDWDDYDNNEGTGEGEDSATFTLTFKVPNDVRVMWTEYKNRMQAQGVSDDNEIFERALIEAINTPTESTEV